MSQMVEGKDKSCDTSVTKMVNLSLGVLRSSLIPPEPRLGKDHNMTVSSVVLQERGELRKD